jgi:hypothetical protein
MPAAAKPKTSQVHPDLTELAVRRYGPGHQVRQGSASWGHGYWLYREGKLLQTLAANLEAAYIAILLGNGDFGGESPPPAQET